jgi:7,8-dihydroneopterin aldolase/epimerase/oxygenase
LSSPDINIIRIKNAVFYAYHGALQDEQNLGGRFEVDIEMQCDFSAAAGEDSLERTVDYEKVYAAVKQLVEGNKFYLIEALGYRIADHVLVNFGLVQSVVVRVRKNNPPIRGVIDAVEVEVRRDK